MTATLYCFGESGNAYKAALTMQLSGYDWQPRYVDFFGGETRRPEFRAINVMGEVPVLIDGETKLSQSGMIQLHVSRRTGKLGGATEAERDEVMRWLLWDNHRLSGMAGPTRFIMNFLAPERRSADVIAYQQMRLKAAYATLDTHLEGRDWIVGKAPTLADCACAGYLYYTEPFGFARGDWPSIDAWLSRLAAEPGWQHPYDLMPGKPSDRAPK